MGGCVGRGQQKLTMPHCTEELKAVYVQSKLPLPALPHTVARLFDGLIGHVLEPRCVQPTFLVGHPVALSPLAHTRPDDVRSPPLRRAARLVLVSTDRLSPLTCSGK